MANQEYVVEELEEQLREQSIKFGLKAVGRSTYETVINEHPLLEEHKAMVEREGQDPETLPLTQYTPIALLAASMVEPEMTIEEATAWFGEEPDGC